MKDDKTKSKIEVPPWSINFPYTLHLEFESENVNKFYEYFSSQIEIGNIINLK